MRLLAAGALLLATACTATACAAATVADVNDPPGQRRCADVTLTTRTPGTALLFDQACYRADNVYSLADGTASYRFTGCAGHSAVWVGAVLTTGPATVTLESGGHTVRVTAFTGQA
ncbi:hypothetical protein SAMN05444920_11560 [Nonomuraea solani]|uniref:Lipoprotein n=1 Tax=Nonomuraea solani TaxID=1144553 RepID=A0A1H6ESL0_9ACTN|nr:hypothetical protein [Nonomuraea solani]SEH00081.1 hypothetical protein SAMN05444920_11560 [Nonomuraea solani]